MKSLRYAICSILLLGLGVCPMLGQDLVAKALSSFPANTIRLEFSSPATLRKLPNYASLRQHYMGPRLKELEASMARLGVTDTDVDQLVLGWNPGGATLNLFGFAKGHFRASVLEASASARNIAPQQIGGKTGYCLGAGLETRCMVVLNSTEGAFGTLSTLSQIMQTLNGGGASIGSNASFAKAVKKEQSSAPIWGVAVASAVASWFKGWMPRQKAVELDWSRVFGGVNLLGYKIETGTNIKLDLEMYCKSEEDAASLHQVLEGLKLAQQIAWQNRNPNRTNPFEHMNLTQTGSQIDLNLMADYSAITGTAAQ